jgi:N-acetylmuramoyl-L-alanine amidase
MIDPGHGGLDSGAVVQGQREADLVLEVSKLLKAKLDTDPRFQAAMTRQENVRVSLGERVKKTEAAKSDLFVSLHLNSNADSRVRGMEVYIQNHLPPDDDSLLLASLENQKELMNEVQSRATNPETESLSKRTDIAMILEDLHRGSRLKASHRLSKHLTANWGDPVTKVNRTIRQAPFYVVTRLGVPAALVELGFLTHHQERQILTQKDSQKQMAENIYRGLVSYIENR